MEVITAHVADNLETFELSVKGSCKAGGVYSSEKKNIF